MDVTSPSRRRFLRLLAASPVVVSSPPALEWLFARQRVAEGSRAEDLASQLDAVLSSPDQALSVLDFELAARQKLPPAHFGYLATGVDDDATLRANREGFSRYAIRVRRLVDVRTIDMSVDLFGTRWPTPIVLAPTGANRAFHPDGEMAVARAARSKRHLQVLSTVATTSVEDVAAERGEPIWFQLYPTSDWAITRALVKRAEGAGCPVLVLTVDLQGGSNRETLRRAERVDTRPCRTCHEPGPAGFFKRRPMFTGIDVSKIGALTPLGMTWDFVKRLRDATSMKLLIKGIVTREDAELAAAHGVDGLIVSNHGGRGEASGRATILALPEVIEGVAGRIPVLVDGGFRRGTDIFKALALGARAICIGRPYLWGLAAFGQPGVEAVLTILHRELQMVMRQAGTVSVDKITRAYLAPA